MVRKISKEMIMSGEARRLYGLETDSGSVYFNLVQNGYSDFEAQAKIFGLKTRPYPRENKSQWDFKPHRHEYAGKIIIDEVWWHKYMPVFVTVNHAWLGKGHMRSGYVINVKRTGSKVIVRKDVAYTKKHALIIAKKFRYDINKYPACQCSCDKCFSGSHCHGLVCRGD